MLVHVSENMPIETFNISFKITPNKQQYGTKITHTELRGGKFKAISNMCFNY